MTNESLSEALRRVAKAKTSPLLPKAFVASQGGPIVPKLIALRGPPKPFPERRPQYPAPSFSPQLLPCS